MEQDQQGSAGDSHQDDIANENSYKNSAEFVVDDTSSQPAVAEDRAGSVDATDQSKTQDKEDQSGAKTDDRAASKADEVAESADEGGPDQETSGGAEGKANGDPQNEADAGVEGEDAKDITAVDEEGAPGPSSESLVDPNAMDFDPPDLSQPIPDDHVPLEDGKKAPLPGVESLFCTSSTLQLLGLSRLVDEADGSAPATLTISKEELLKDIQYRGTISDFHYMKKMIEEADYDPLVVRANKDDRYGDGNNIELVCRKSAADLWRSIDEEVERRRRWAELEAVREAAQKALPRSKRTWKRRPWESQGSEAEIEQSTVAAAREPISMVAQRKRRHFNQEYKLSDRDAHELWNSAQMECRPFKDPNFELKRAELELAVQAVPEVCDRGVQATGRRPCPGSMQYSPRQMGPEERKAAMAAEDLQSFLRAVTPKVDAALQQNEITNVFEDDFTMLAEEDGISGNKKENVISEYQSFTDLTYSKNKIVQAIQWVPGAKGVVAVACTEPLNFMERVQTAGRPTTSAILIWNFKDPIHPEYVLESPFEVTSFQFNPRNHKTIVAGLFNGRIVYWDISNAKSLFVAAKKVKKEDGKEEETTVPVIKAAYVSAPDASHKTLVTDLTWLQGIDITRDGKVIDVNSDEAREKGIDPKECNYFATTAADGCVMFWDIRIERSRKRGQRESDEIVWSPLYTVPLLDQNGRDFASQKFSFHLKDPTMTEVLVGSQEGEIMYADYRKPEGVDHPEYSKFCVDGHSGPVVSVERSPFYDFIILTVGDWCFSIWKEGLETAIFVSPFATNYLTAGCWSPTRPGVIYIAKQDGELDVWDLLDRSHEPAITATISSTPVMSIRFNERVTTAAQQMLAVGDSVGALHIMELPRNLRRPVANEKTLMQSFLSRQESRLSFKEKELVPARAARHAELEAAAAAAAAKENEASTRPRDTGNQVSAQEKIEMEYEKLERDFMIELGLIAEEVQE